MTNRVFLALPLLVALPCGQARAQPVVFYGADPAATIGSPIPQSNAAAAAMDAAAAALGTINRINFESLPIGNFQSMAVAPGVTVTLTGLAVESGIQANGWFGGVTPAILGFNTTPGGSKFLGHVPVTNIGTANIRWDFATPIQAFGAYLTGFEALNSPLLITFNDGSARTITVPGVVGAGAAFSGFTDAGRSIVAIDYTVTGIGSTREIYAIDDVRYVNIPSPATLAGLLLGGGMLRPVRRSRPAPVVPV